jgi:hypothetical protein
VLFRSNSLSLTPAASPDIAPTNSSPPAQASAPDKSRLAADAEEPKPPAVDPDMDEARRILIDYIGLLSKRSPLLATHASEAN